MNNFTMQFKNGKKISFKDERTLEQLRSDIFNNKDKVFCLNGKNINTRSINTIKYNKRNGVQI